MITEIITKNSSQVQIATTLGIHLNDATADTACHLTQERQVSVALYKERYNLPIHRTTLGKSLQGIKHPPIPLRQDTHRNTARRMHNKPHNIANLGSHLSNGTICDGNDIKVCISGNWVYSVTPSDTAHMMS